MYKKKKLLSDFFNRIKMGKNRFKKKKLSQTYNLPLVSNILIYFKYASMYVQWLNPHHMEYILFLQ